MPLSASQVHLDGVKTRELERRASCTSLHSDRAGIEDNLDGELADLLPVMSRLSLDSKERVCAWPRGRVPYAISDDLQRNHPDICRNLHAAIDRFRRQVVSVDWIERAYEDDYVEFIYSKSECSSRVGCVGGRQEIKLASWAKPGNVLHEMGHAIGLEHEHSRLDRDHFVKVHTHQIQEGRRHNFAIRLNSIPLGPYDYGSIMHYPDGVCTKGGTTTATIVAPPTERIGQRNEFSQMDLTGIESIYGTLKCSYEQHGEKYWPQVWFECRKCWGGESNYGCCLVCALDCHSGPDHLLVSHQLSKDMVFVCDCGRNRHQKAVCTWHSTKTKGVKQPFYRCYDCFKGALEGCCFQCVINCHAGHNTRFDSITDSSCDCGLECCRVNCIIPGPLKCTFESRGEDYHSQRWYECRTCWGGESNYGCCAYCAFNCHKGHHLVFRKNVTAVCDCGRNRHQKAVCTWHSTKSKYVKQPFYRCYDCFKGAREGCCFQCVINCHAGHNTKFDSIANPFCDCGLKCCRITCSIASPK